MNFILTNNLQFETQQRRTLFSGLTFSIQNGDKIGLVGRNGVGKSTLMKVMAGLLQPTTGSVVKHTHLYYLPQVQLESYKKEQTLYEYCSKRVESWWDIFVMLRSDFNILLSEDASVSSLSGGEMMKLNLCIGLVQKPKLLLLDEPTNHLDANGRAYLVSFLESFRGAYLIASHDTYFLNTVVTSIWELEDGKVEVSGGNFSDYKRIKQERADAQMRKYEDKRREVQKLKRARMREHNRNARIQAKGKRDAKSGTSGIPKIIRNGLRNDAEKSSGKKSVALQNMAAAARDSMEALKLQKKKKAGLSLQDTKKGRELLTRVEDGRILLKTDIGVRLLLEGVNNSIRYGDRIRISGSNGSGKTTLVKSLIGQSNKDVQMAGEWYKKDTIIYSIIDQKYDLIQPGLSLLENVRQVNISLSSEQLRKQLGSVLFIGELEMNKLAKFLSGGEIARLTFAMVTARPIDVLILDEPTNNIDIETKEVIIEALQAFHGALLIISHDEGFVEELEIDQVWKIEEGKLLFS